MKKKVVGSLVAVALIALLTFMLVGCTVSGTYTSKLGNIKFTGSSFTYTIKILNKEVTEKGKFQTEKITDEDKEDVETALSLAKLDKDALKGTIVLKNEDGKEIAAGFYGKKDDKNYVILLGEIMGVFTK